MLLRMDADRRHNYVERSRKETITLLRVIVGTEEEGEENTNTDRDPRTKTPKRQGQTKSSFESFLHSRGREGGRRGERSLPKSVHKPILRPDQVETGGVKGKIMITAFR